MKKIFIMKRIVFIIALIFVSAVCWGQDYYKIGCEYVLSKHPEYEEYLTEYDWHYSYSIGKSICKIKEINNSELTKGSIKMAKNYTKDINIYMYLIGNEYKKYLKDQKQKEYERTHQNELRAELNKILEDI